MKKKSIQAVSLLFFFMIFCHCNEGFAEDKDRYVGFGIGGGINLESINTRQILLAPDISWNIKDQKLLRFRLEGALEFIDDDGRVAVIGGVAPFVRFLLSEKNVRPFFEVGAGVNLTSRDEVKGRQLGGTFLFSLMGGAGFEILMNKSLISISYRFRHLSNGGLYSHNHGLNSQYLIISVGF